MPVIALWSPSDHLLSVLAPIGLALSRRPSLVIDLDEHGPRFPSPFTLADLVKNGPTAAQLHAAPGGPHVLANGGVEMARAHDVVGALAQHWPHVVLRCPPHRPPPDSALKIMPLLGAAFVDPRTAGRLAFQDLGLGVDPPKGSRVLPRPRTSTLRALCEFRRPIGSKWVRSLAQLWEAA